MILRYYAICKFPLRDAESITKIGHRRIALRRLFYLFCAVHLLLEMDQQGILLWSEMFLQVRDTILVDDADTPDLRLAPSEPANRLLPAALEEKEQRIRRGVVTRPRFDASSTADAALSPAAAGRALALIREAAKLAAPAGRARGQCALDRREGRSGEKRVRLRAIATSGLKLSMRAGRTRSSTRFETEYLRSKDPSSWTRRTNPTPPSLFGAPIRRSGAIERQSPTVTTCRRRGGGARGASVIGCHLALLSVFQGFHLPPRKFIPYEEEYVD